ncbi:hypothetical protein HN51_064802 [Arachis hypogaea]|uniref:DUF1682 family protein n=1 Tax=Arachis hypogaea TaxID=3818 RepID=A0A444ZCB5_ARAHY|nr:uncharacterized protein At5g49945 [Arachis hypogaea]QHO05826.1 uncharacterized protein DS421_14g449430 [Arachis hypogaea]RYR11738.1 hypothetical protein Ahy_B04g069257 [Arachis hypogaea]
MGNRSQRCRRLLYLLTLLCIFLSLSLVAVGGDSHFEGFEAEDDEFEDASIDPTTLRSPPSQPLTTDLTPPTPADPQPDPKPAPSDLPKPPPTTFDFWDEDEFEGLPIEHPSPDQDLPADPVSSDHNASLSDPTSPPTQPDAKRPRSFTVEIVCISFLIVFAINYFTGKRENENIALSWAAQFAAKDSIFEKNFSLLGIGDGGDDSPLLLKEGQTTFKFYASGRRYCQGLLATLELKSRHDLIARIYNMVVPTRDEISFEVYMNDDAMDHVVFAMAKKKAAKAMHKDVKDLQRFAGFVSAPNGRKWITDDLAVISESKEVAGELITDAVIDQVFGEKAFEKYGKSLISLHFSDQHPGRHRKVLMFKFALPSAKNMADMTRLVALVPYYIDLIGRYKLSPQARSKTETARQKAAQEAQKELRNAQQEAMQRRKAERKKMMEEAEAKLSAEAIRKKEAKERARQMKKAMPRMKMARGA